MDTHAGSGTSVTLYLPRTMSEPEPREESAVSATTNEMGHERVLVVDDEPGLLSLTARRLSRQGYKVMTANDGQSALQLLEREPGIDLLFTDVVMPGGMNGYELAECAVSRFPQLKVLLTTGFTPDKATEVPHTRVDRQVLPKPYGQQLLLERIRQVLDSAA